MAQYAPISSDFDTKFAYEVYDTTVGGKRVRVSVVSFDLNVERKGKFKPMRDDDPDPPQRGQG